MFSSLHFVEVHFVGKKSSVFLIILSLEKHKLLGSVQKCHVQRRVCSARGGCVMAKPCPALCIKTLKPARRGGHCFISIRIMISREIVNEMK